MKPERAATLRLIAEPQKTKPRKAATLAFVRPASASLDPREFAPPHDLVDELRNNIAAHYADGPDSVAILGFPQNLKTWLDKIRARAWSGREKHSNLRCKPGLHPTAAAALSYGVHSLFEHPLVQEFISTREEFDARDALDSAAEEVVAQFLRQQDVELVVSGATIRRQNIAISSTLKADLARLASEVGASQSSVALVAALLALSVQPRVPTDVQDRFRQEVVGFLRKTRLRMVGAIALLRAFDALGKHGQEVPK